MANLQKKVQCVLWFEKFESVIRVQREYRNFYNEQPPHRNNIRRWCKKFKDTGSVQDKKRSGRPPIRNESVELIHDSVIQSPKKSVRRRSLQLGVPKSSVHKVLKKRLKLTPYKIQRLHAMKPDDNRKRYDFAVDTLEGNFLNRILFSDEATFHVSGHVHCHNVRIWAIENPHAYVEYERNSPKVNVWCAIGRDRIVGPFFFAESTVTSIAYLDMLQLFTLPQIENEDLIFQQDGAPPHYAQIVREFLDQHFSRRWIGRGGWKPWPPRSPDLSPMDFYFWGHVKQYVYSEHIVNIRHLKQRIQSGVALVTRDILRSVWRELEYRLDLCRANNGAHVELR